MSVVIREARKEEAETIAKVAAQTFTETFAWYNTAENMREYNETHFNEEQILREIADERSNLFVALSDNEIIGYAKLKSAETPEEIGTSSGVEIERLYVKKEF